MEHETGKRGGARRSVPRAGGWWIAIALSVFSNGCTGHPLRPPLEAGLIDERLGEFLRYQHAIHLLTNRPSEGPRHGYETLRARLPPEGMPFVASRMPGPQGFERLRQGLIAEPSRPALLAGYLQHQYRRLARSDGERESRPAFAWQWLFWGRAALIAFERTRDPSFLELLARGFGHLDGLRGVKRGIADPARGGVLSSWPSGDPSGGYRYEASVAGLMILPACQFARTVKAQPALHAAYLAKAQQVLEVIREVLAEFSGDYRETRYGYGRLFRPGRRRVEPLSHAHAYAAALECLNHTAQTPLRPEILKGLQRTFVAALWRTKAGSIAWGHAPSPPEDLDRPAEWIWKAAVTLAWPYEAYRLGGRFDIAFMRELARVFRSGIHLGGIHLGGIHSGGDGVLNARISPDDRVDLTPLVARGGHTARLQSLAAWIVLGEFDPEVRRSIEEAVAHRPDIFPAGWLGSAPGAYAYAFRLGEAGTR